MGYSYSSKSVKKLSSYLDILLTSDQDEVSWVTNDASKFSYQLYNSLKSAEVLAILPYNELRKSWQIKAKDGIVTAVKSNTPITLLGATQAKDVFDILDYFSHLTNPELPIIFPNVSKDKETLETLYMWTNNSDLGMMVTEKGIVVCMKNEHCWRPENERNP